MTRRPGSSEWIAAVVHHVSYYVTFMVRWTVIDGKWAREPPCLNGHKIGHSPFCSFGSRLFWGVTYRKIVPSFCSLKYFYLSLWGLCGPPYLGMVQQPPEQSYPFLSVCAISLCIQTVVWLPVLQIVLNALTDFSACNCTSGLHKHCRRICTDSWPWEKSP